MLLTTTPNLEGHPIQEYLGIITAESLLGDNYFKDLSAGLKDMLSGRTGTHEQAILEEARAKALHMLETKAAALGATAVVGITLGVSTVGSAGILMATATGTAVKTTVG